MIATLGLLAPVLTAGPLQAEPVTLSFPVTAVQTGAREDAPVRFALVIGAFDGTQVPVRIVDGALSQRAFRLEGVTDNTLTLTRPLAAQLEQAGFTVRFDCATTACGGFDFRFALDVLPEPQMHVDLGDFRYLAADNVQGDVVALLVSRAADQGFVQLTSVIKGQGPALAATPQITADVATAAPVLPEPIQIDLTPPAPEPDGAAPADPQPATPIDPGGLGAALLTRGSVALDDLVFASGKAALQDQDYASLAALAKWLAANPDLKVTLVGHTDASGTLAGNVALSKQRAALVRDQLIRMYAVPSTQMDAQGAGYLSPRASNQTPEGRQQNRRVEVMLTSTPVK